jgi:hypothetical protein
LGDAELLVIEIKGVKVEAVTVKEQFMVSKDHDYSLSPNKNGMNRSFLITRIDTDVICQMFGLGGL